MSLVYLYFGKLHSKFSLYCIIIPSPRYTKIPLLLRGDSKPTVPPAADGPCSQPLWDAGEDGDACRREQEDSKLPRSSASHRDVFAHSLMQQAPSPMPAGYVRPDTCRQIEAKIPPQLTQQTHTGPGNPLQYPSGRGNTYLLHQREYQ